MSIKREPKKVKLIIVIFSNDINLLDETEEKLIKKYGIIDHKSIDYDFNETDYYFTEMGDKLKIRYLSFKNLKARSALTEIKEYCWNLEQKNTKTEKRRINIDPGFLSLENFILATGKSFSHRIYLSKGVYADLTLIYQKSGFIELPWTYPSYKNTNIKRELLKIRKIYSEQLKEL